MIYILTSRVLKVGGDLTELKDGGMIPELERTIAEYVGKEVKITFREVDTKTPKKPRVALPPK